MKNSIYKITTLALVVVLIFSGCSKLEDFGTTNDRPDATTNPNTAALLTNVLTGIGDFAARRGCGLYCQYFSETQYPELSLYTANLTTPMALYSGALYDLQHYY